MTIGAKTLLSDATRFGNSSSRRDSRILSSLPERVADKIADDGQFLFAGNGVRLDELTPFDRQSGLFQKLDLLSDFGKRNQRILRAVGEEQPLAGCDRRKFGEQFLRLEDIAADANQAGK